MQISQIAPLTESVPPKLYGGTERVVSHLTEELVRRGHRVTLFASADSQTSAELASCADQALRFARGVDPLAMHLLMLEEVLQQSSRFDVLHFHTGYLHFPASRRRKFAHLTTMHGPVDGPDAAIYRHFREAPLVSISYSQRAPAPQLRWVANVYHGYPRDLFRFEPRAGDKLVFLGRISPEKRVDRAIEIAVRSDLPLVIAAKVDAVDEEYFHEKIKPLLTHPKVEFIGEVDDRQKTELLGSARALLFPVEWREPFGLAMIEALACGTPVIAYRRGSIPEIVQHGVTGYVVDNIEDAVRAVERLDLILRETCRADFEERFSVESMASGYEQVYETLCTGPASLDTVATVA